MIRLYLLMCVLLSMNCCNSDSDPITASPASLRIRNLALAYIDSGMYSEANEKLSQLEQLLPAEPFVYANQGLIALRINNLKLAQTLLEKADILAPNNPDIALLRSEVAMLVGEFELSVDILDVAIEANPKHIQLRWANNDFIEHVQNIVHAMPQNIVARLALIKKLILIEKIDDARIHLLALQEQGVIQDDQAMRLFIGSMESLDNEKTRVALGQVIGLDNVLKSTRPWQQSQLDVAGAPGTIGHPIRNFVNTTVPKSSPPKERTISFTKNNDSILPAGKKRVLLVESPTQSELVTAQDPFTIKLISIDWNNDRKLDVVSGTSKGRIYVENGKELLAENGTPITALTAWDADQDGDLDLLVTRGKTFLLQNNGDESVTIRELKTPALHSMHIIDIDEDGAVDLVGISPEMRLIVLKNERSGSIRVLENTLPDTLVFDLVVGDFNNDGWMDIAWIDVNGAAVVGENNTESSFLPRIVGGFGITITAADIDNDSQLDIIVGGEQIQILQANGKMMAIPAFGDVQIIDVDLDGDLDIVTTGDEYAVWYQDGIPAENEFQKIILEAILQGGQRNNSLAVGGFVEVSAGGTYQKHLITGPLTHIGLGGVRADAIRVVWPNGVPQEVIEPAPNQIFTEIQILKGSCPFLATSTKDGTWEFVTDLLWRSPLGLKINAQTVPPIASTRDWVKVRGDQIVGRDGVYELAITAQLWETHFIDEISMIAIDHPVDTEIFVDERFVAPVPPSFAIYMYNEIHTPISAVDQAGTDVLNIIRIRDGIRLGGFTKGPYQGVAENHYVEIDLGEIDDRSRVDIIAQGWIRPTDTSINVSSAQGSTPPPKALEVSVPDGAGGWAVVVPNAGFPAGKLKTIILEIPAGSFSNNDYRVRIATNLEIYWDSLSHAARSTNTHIVNQPVTLLSADLGYMGFPVMSRSNDDAPNIPDYNNIRHGKAWRDLEGFYTRYGAVENLIAEVDDRYVIMNAGDAMYVQFEALGPPLPGMTRDFIFFSDGWVKDGDWNTVASRTVGPLPHHAMSGYPYPKDERPIELLPSYPDWQEFHTRYITPAPFRDVMK